MPKFEYSYLKFGPGSSVEC